MKLKQGRASTSSWARTRTRTNSCLFLIDYSAHQDSSAAYSNRGVATMKRYHNSTLDPDNHSSTRSNIRRQSLGTRDNDRQHVNISRLNIKTIYSKSMIRPNLKRDWLLRSFKERGRTHAYRGGISCGAACHQHAHPPNLLVADYVIRFGLDHHRLTPILLAFFQITQARNLRLI